MPIPPLVCGLVSVVRFSLQGPDSAPDDEGDTKSGHGAGKPTSKSIEEYTDIFCFLVHRFSLCLEFDYNYPLNVD